MARMKPLVCPVCQKEHWPKGRIRWKFCSRRCYNAKRAEFWKPVDLVCTCCRTTFQRPAGVLKHRHGKPFCSLACVSRYHSGENHPLYRAVGHSERGRGPLWKRIAEQIRALDNYRCRRCGRTQAENGKRRLEVDHIVPWREFEDKTLANQPENLASLCVKCHRYKTAVVEPAYFRGDMLAMDEYKRVVQRDDNGNVIKERIG